MFVREREVQPGSCIFFKLFFQTSKGNKVLLSWRLHSFETNK